MADPILLQTQVQISYKASDGYRAEVGYSSQRASCPEAVYVEAIEELSRLAHLFGFGAKAREAFDAAGKRVEEWQATRGMAERHPRCGYPYCGCVAECFAASQPGAPGVAMDQPENKHG